MIKVNGVEVVIAKNSMNIDDAIEERSTASFVVIDKYGIETYSKGQTVEITDDDSNIVFAGVIGKPIEKKDVVTGIKYHTLSCVDWHYLADKRIIANAYEDTLAGDIIADIWKKCLKDEGISIGYSTYFNGTSAVAKTPYIPSYDMTEFTVECWFNSTYVGAWFRTIISKYGDTTVTPFWGLGWMAPSTLGITIRDATSARDTAMASIGEGLDGNWHTLRGVVTNSAVKFYIDGVLKSSVPKTIGSFANDRGVFFGYHFGSYAQLGLAEVRLWSGEVESDMYSGLIGNESGLVGYWKLDKDRDNLTEDSSVNKNNGTVSNIDYVKNTFKDCIQDGPLVTEAVFNYVTVPSAIDAIAEKANYIWLIDFDKKLHFVERSTYSAPFAVTTKDAIKNSVSVEKDNTKYRNKQYIKGGRDITDPLTESFSGDGKTRTWGVGFPIAKVPTVKLNGVALGTIDVGIRGLDTDKKYYWSKGYNEITQDDSQALLISTSTLEITYQGEYDIVAITFDPEQIDARKTIEGNSGIVENVADEIENTSRDTAFQSANAKLKKFGTIGRRLNFTTLKTGLKTGQLLTVNMPEHGVDGLQMLIESITVSRQDNMFYYRVSAVEGPSQQSWAKMFEVMATRGQAFVVRQNISEKQILITLATFSKTWETATDPNIFEEVYASDTLFPSATLYPMFAITDRVKYIELLNSSNAVLLRKSVTKQVGADTASILSTIYVAPFEANAQIATVRFYGGMRATLANGTGVMVDEQVYSKLKTQLEAIQLEKTDIRNFVPTTGAKALSTAYWQSVDDAITALTAHSA